MHLIIEYSLFIVSILSFILTFSYCILKIDNRILLNITIGLLIAVSSFSLQYYSWQIFYFPLTLFIPISIIISIFIYFKRIPKIQMFSAAIYFVNMILLLIGTEILKSPGTTWGNSAIYTGIFLAVNILIVLQLITYLCPFNFFYGILKLVFCIITIIILFVNGWPSSEWVGEFELLIRKGTILMIIILFLESILLIYKSSS